MRVANAACGAISDVAWQQKIFNKVRWHHNVYHPLRSIFELSSQMLIRSIAKMADAYALDKKTKRTFKPLTQQVDDFIGCDFGITDIVVTSDGVKHSADGLNTYREHIGKRTGKHFKCNNCGSHMDTAANASLTIASLGRAVNRARKSNAMCCAIAHVVSGLKHNPSLGVVG